jgi:VWFA-related protein
MKFLTSLAVAATFVFVRVDLAAQQAPKPEAQETLSSNSASDQTQTANSKLTVHSNLVFLPTRVQKKNGEPIYGLKPEQFIIEDNGVPQTVHIEETLEAAGLSLVVVLQCSRFAEAELDKLKNLGTMLEAIVGDGPHEIAVMSYGEAPYLLGNFSSRPQVVRSALSRLKPCGCAAQAITIDAVYYAIGMLKRRKNHNRPAILLISENRDHGSHSKLEDVVAELGVTDTVIYSLTFSPGRDSITEALRHPYGRPQSEPEFKPWPVPSSSPPPSPSPEPTPSPQPSPEENDSLLPPEPVYLVHPPRFTWPSGLTMAVNALRRNTASQLALLSGGEYMRFTTQRSLEDELQLISNRIHNYYLLSFRPPPVPALGLHSLSVRIPDYPDALIQTRKHYWSGIIETPSGDDRQSH